MDKKLQDKLFKKYPELFRQKNLSMRETCMCWGLSCSAGWYTLLDNLCSWLNWNMKNNSHMFPQVEFTQIKEKFGTLRAYYTTRALTEDEYNKLKKKEVFLPKTYKEYLKSDLIRGGEEISGVVSFAEHLSGTICEICGLPGKTIEINKWWHTVCSKHEKEIRNGRK